MVVMPISLFLSLVFFSFPFVFMQSFLGQFSSSGFISAFRITPLFKGIGYIALAINLCSLTYYAIFAAVPLLLFINSLQPTLPWKCDETCLSERDQINDASYSSHNDTYEFLYHSVEVPSVYYFWNQFENIFSISLYGCVIVVWLVVAFVLCNTTEKIGQMLRYCSMILITLLGIIFLRMLFLPGVLKALARTLERKGAMGFDFQTLLQSVIFAPFFALSNFGPGWGSILTMASYNKFKTDIKKSSWIICFSQLGIQILTMLICIMAESHLTYIFNTKKYMITERRLWESFLSILSSLETIEFPHLWTWIFLAVLFIGNFNLMIIQMFSVLTAIFDEYEKPRHYKKGVTLGLSGILALVTAFYCTKSGIHFTELLVELSVYTQANINYLLLIIIVWVYGRERLQRDFAFMTNRVIQTWKIYIVRFVTPIFLFLISFFGFLVLFQIRQTEFIFRPDIFDLGVVLTTFSWITLPIYCVFKLMQTRGSFVRKFMRCVKPTDWYPTNLEHRQQYEETIVNRETIQPLTII